MAIPICLSVIGDAVPVRAVAWKLIQPFSQLVGYGILFSRSSIFWHLSEYVSEDGIAIL